MTNDELAAAMPEDLPSGTGEISVDPPDVVDGNPIDETTGGGQPGEGENTDNPNNNLNNKKKMSTSETGHAKNVANFKVMTEHCEQMGTTYNPSNPALSLAALKTLGTSGENALTAVSALFPVYAKRVGERQHAFMPLDQLVMRVQNSLESSGAIPQVVETGRTLTRKLLGRRATAKLTEEEKQAIEAETGQPVVEHSSSQQSFDSNIDYFGRLIDLLKTVSEYAPNETDLQVASLTTFHEEMKTRNTALVKAALALNKARENRDMVLYADTTGLVDISTAVKKYIKSATSASSPEFKAVSALQFKSYKK